MSFEHGHSAEEQQLAPQPCLGICVWRPVEWVRLDVYERERILPELEKERRVRALVSRVASVTPRADQWERSWHVFQREAQEAIAIGGVCRANHSQ